MLADANISRADVSKAIPPGTPVGHRAHARRRPQRGPASGGVGSGGAAYRLQDAAAEEEDRRTVAAEERRAGGGGESGRVVASRRAAASGTEMRVKDGEGGRRRGRPRRRCVCVREERRGASEKRGASGTGAARRGVTP
jgi:hypothetical protein